MTEPPREPRSTPSTAPEPLVRCRRTGQEVPVGEHCRCPYCFGRSEQVRSGEHATFCDFRPGRDPVHFGFPEDLGRDLRS